MEEESIVGGSKNHRLACGNGDISARMNFSPGVCTCVCACREKGHRELPMELGDSTSPLVPARFTRNAAAQVRCKEWRHGTVMLKIIHRTCGMCDS
jgi:hypothetical protein